MEKFKQQPDEKVLMKGSLIYVQGEPGFKNYLKGKTTVMECTGILTSKRFVACKKRKFFPWGPLIWLFILARRREIVFMIALSSFASIKYDKGSGKNLLMKASDGSEYRVVWTRFYDKTGKWVRAITDAIVEACPGTKGQVTDGLVEFVKRS